MMLKKEIMSFSSLHLQCVSIGKNHYFTSVIAQTEISNHHKYDIEMHLEDFYYRLKISVCTHSIRSNGLEHFLIPINSTNRIGNNHFRQAIKFEYCLVHAKIMQSIL